MILRHLIAPMAILAFIYKNWGDNIDFLRVLIGAQVLREDVIIENEIVSLPVDVVLPFIASLSMLAGFALAAAAIIYCLERFSPVLSDTYRERKRLHKEDRRLSGEYQRKIAILQQCVPMADEAIAANLLIYDLKQDIKVLSAEVRALRDKRCSCLKAVEPPEEQLDFLDPMRRRKSASDITKPKKSWWQKLKVPEF